MRNVQGPSLLKPGEQPRAGQYALKGDLVVFLQDESDQGNFWIKYVQTDGPSRGGGGGSSGRWEPSRFRAISDPRHILLAQVYHARREARRLKQKAKAYEKASRIFDAALTAVDVAHEAKKGENP